MSLMDFLIITEKKLASVDRLLRVSPCWYWSGALVGVLVSGGFYFASKDFILICIAIPGGSMHVRGRPWMFGAPRWELLSSGGGRPLS